MHKDDWVRDLVNALRAMAAHPSDEVRQHTWNLLCETVQSAIPVGQDHQDKTWFGLLANTLLYSRDPLTEVIEDLARPSV